MSISLSQFRTRFPEFDTVNDSEVNFALSDASDEMDVTRWGNRFDSGQGFLAAHYVSISSTGSSAVGGSVGAYSQATTGPLTVTKNIPMAKNQTEAMLSGTSYGQRYLRLRNIISKGGVIV